MTTRAIAALCLLFLVTCIPGANTNARETDRTFTLDEGVWILFYDVPSRRFLRIRDAFVRRDWEAVGNDLNVCAAFIRSEATRSVDELVFPLENLADRLDVIAESIGTSAVKGSDLDAAFARAHWLLAQHYLEFAQRARDESESRIAGSYLWATAHHLERTVLWSDARLSRAQLASLDKLRDLAGKLKESDAPAEIYNKKPVALARKTLKDLGESMDRKIWIEYP